MDTASTRIEQAVARLTRSYALGQPADLRALAAECGSLADLATLRLLVEDYPLRWKHGRAALVEDYLRLHGTVVPDEVRLDLMRQEIAQRKRDPSRFGAPIPVEYRRRFPELDDTALGAAFAIASSLAADSVVTWLFRGTQSAPAAAPPEPPPLDPGPMTLGDAYRITGLIGQGGSKIVYRGVQLSTRQAVAIKQPLLHLLQGTDDEVRHNHLRFLREGRIQARLNHQNIPAVFTVAEGSPERPPLIVERLARGREWSSVLRQRPLPENLRVLLQVARALAVAHDDGVIHCDLKPRNVMVSDAGDEVYVLDWELALHVGPPDPHHPAPHYTTTRDIRGTPGYLPPEMTRENRVLSPATDVFLLGGILYEILTHTTPYNTRDVHVNTWLAHDPTYTIPTPQQRLEEQGRSANVPLELERIATQALQRDPSRRYRHAREFADAILLYLDHLPLEARVQLTEATLDEIARDLLPLRDQLPVLLEEYPAFQTRLLRVADEFAQVRRTWRMAVPPLNEPGEARSSYWRAVDGELVARMQLITLAHLFGQDQLFVRGQLLTLDDMPPQIGDRVDEVRRAVATMGP